MTYEQCFTTIKNRLSDTSKSNLTENFAIQVQFISKDCSGIFYIQSKNGELYVEPYDYYDHDASITIDYTDLEKLIDGKLDVDSSIDENQIYVNGSKEKVKLIAKLAKPKRRTTKTQATAETQTTVETKPTAKRTRKTTKSKSEK